MYGCTGLPLQSKGVCEIQGHLIGVRSTSGSYKFRNLCLGSPIIVNPHFGFTGAVERRLTDRDSQDVQGTMPQFDLKAFTTSFPRQPKKAVAHASGFSTFQKRVVCQACVVHGRVQLLVVQLHAQQNTTPKTEWPSVHALWLNYILHDRERSG